MALLDKSGRREWLIPALVLLGLVCIFMGPVIFGGRVFLPAAHRDINATWSPLSWDVNAIFYPSRVLVGRAIRSGEWPLWNPHEMGGIPLATSQSGALYPLNALYAILPPECLPGILAALHLFLAGFFMFLFLRGLKLSLSASTFGGIVFMLCGFSVTWLQTPGFLSAGAWLPLTLHLSRRAQERRSVSYAAGAGVTIALSILGGHPQIVFYCLLATVCYWVYLASINREQVPPVISILLAGFAVGIGLMLAAPQLLLGMELTRGTHIVNEDGFAVLPWRNLITFLCPNFFGNPAKGTFWGMCEYADYCGYIGILPLMLIPTAFVGKVRRHAWFFSGLGVLAFFMALGTASNMLLHVPGFADFGSPARVLFLYMFATAALAAFGAQHLLESVGEKRSLVLGTVTFGSLGLLLLCLVLFCVNASALSDMVTPSELWKHTSTSLRLSAVFLLVGIGIIRLMVRQKIVSQLGVALLACVLLSDLLYFGTGYNHTCTRAQAFPKTEVIDFLKANAGLSRIMPLNDHLSPLDIPESILPPNIPAIYGLYDVSGYGSSCPVRYRQLLDTANRDSSSQAGGDMVFARRPESPVYDLLGVRWVISKTPQDSHSRRIDGLYVSERKGALPRAFIVDSMELASDDEALSRIASGKANLRTQVLVDSHAMRLLDPWSPESIDKETAYSSEKHAAIRRYTFNKVDISVDAARPGVLVLTDNYFPGWTAYVDGREKPVVRADYNFRAVSIPAGKHTVRFSYEPESIRKGLGLAWTAVLIIVCSSLVSVRRRGLPAGTSR